MRVPGTLCLKSISLRTITDLAVLATTVRGCGLDAVDISGCHAGYSTPPRYASVVSTLAERGVTIAGNGVAMASADPVQMAPIFAFAKIAKSPVVSLHLPLPDHREALATACAMAELHDVRLALHNHGGAHWHGSSEAMRYLLALGGPRLGLCLDSGWVIDAGEDPLEWIRAFGARIHAVHLKDFTFDRMGKETDVVLGQGVLNLRGFLAGLTDSGFTGPMAIEYEGHEADVTPAIRACVAALAG